MVRVNVHMTTHLTVDKMDKICFNQCNSNCTITRSRTLLSEFECCELERRGMSIILSIKHAPCSDHTTRTQTQNIYTEASHQRRRTKTLMALSVGRHADVFHNAYRPHTRVIMETPMMTTFHDLSRDNGRFVELNS